MTDPQASVGKMARGDVAGRDEIDGSRPGLGGCEEGRTVMKVTSMPRLIMSSLSIDTSVGPSTRSSRASKSGTGNGYKTLWYGNEERTPASVVRVLPSELDTTRNPKCVYVAFVIVIAIVRGGVFCSVFDGCGNVCYC